MPFVRGTDGTEDDLPTYIRKAFGKDRSWMQHGSCHPRNRHPDVPHVAWAVPHGETRVIDGVRYVGDDMEAFALPICRACPQQWLCGRWAIEVEERTGTWALAFADLRWLQKQPDALTIIDAARASEIPVQVAVRIVRAKRV